MRRAFVSLLCAAAVAAAAGAAPASRFGLEADSSPLGWQVLGPVRVGAGFLLPPFAVETPAEAAPVAAMFQQGHLFVLGRARFPICPACGGLALAWDLTQRGLGVTLVEAGDFCSATSSRCRGLLHSGARDVVSSPGTAKECIEENAILRRIVPCSIDDTGGMLVLGSDDGPSFVEPWREGCRRAGHPVMGNPMMRMSCCRSQSLPLSVRASRASPLEVVQISAMR